MAVLASGSPSQPLTSTEPDVATPNLTSLRHPKRDMAEIVGIVAAVPALLGAIRAVSNKIGSLRTAFTESSNTLTALAEECDSTAAVLGTVHSLAAGQPDLFTGEDANISLVHTFEKAVPQCSTIIATLRKEIESYGGSSSVRERAKFALNEQKLKEILERLRGQRSSVHFVMAGLQLWVSDCLSIEPDRR